MMTINADNPNCLCASGLSYTDCCARYHNGEALAPTAEALMRSRFTAYALRNVDYLLSSWHVAKRPAKLDFSKETAIWQRLEIIDCKKGKVGDTKGIVEFKAFYQQDGEDYQLHEISRFEKIAGRWCYLDGVIKAAGRVKPQLASGRNALCSCGSGKKFKRCCGP